MRRLLALALFSLSASPVALHSQTAPHKILTSQQRVYQAQIADWKLQHDTLRDKGRQALADEDARAKGPECPNTNSTRDEEVCLSAEIAKTQQNYVTFTGALRSLLALPYPTMPGEKFVPGLEGTPPTAAQSVANFDKLESESKLYRENAASIAFEQYQGGTLAPVFEMESILKLTRLHMQELAFVYGELLSTH
jgi:hypothetical protein